MQASPADQTPLPRKRLDLVDALRGLALAAMVIFHGAWDLSNADLIATDIGNHAAWQWFARSIAASFLTITGVSLVLAHANGFHRQRFWRRWLLLAGAAGLVTLGTWFMAPETHVFFGILHHIALASIFALAFLRLPPPLTALAAILAFALPFFIRSDLFDPLWLVWTGLAVRVPDSVDFVPFFPWVSFVLAGVALGRIGQGWLQRQGWQAQDPVTRTAALAGRHSLVFYLVHQPILLGLIGLYVQGTSLQLTHDPMQRFESDCRTACIAQKAPAEFCAKACTCTREASVRKDSLAAALRSGRLDRFQELQLTEISQTCSREAEAGAGSATGPTKP